MSGNRIAGGGMNERVVRFGGATPLVGVLAEPPSASHVGRPSVILLNAGTLHRIGPHRVYVKIARRLVRLGFPVLRFDLSGLGDSPMRRDNLPLRESTLEEARAAMDFVRRETGATHFALAGFCGGAELAFRAACSDTRVVAAALVDWYAYPSFGWWTRRYLAPLIHPRGWWDLIRGRGPVGDDMRRWLSRSPRGSVMNDGPVPPKAQAARHLRELISRDVQLLFVYSGAGRRYYNYRRQFEDAFGSLNVSDHVQVEFFADSDHTLTLLHHQARIIECMADWMDRACNVRSTVRAGRPRTLAISGVERSAVWRA